jgi:hypothetical protein
MFSTFKFMGGLLPGTVPGAPTSVAVVRGGSDTVTFVWNVPASNGNRSITGYTVNLDGVGSRSVGFSTIGGYQGRTYGYNWITGCTTCNYNGSVQAVNSIGTGSAASGGPACAFSGYLLSSGNCSGYTRYDTYTDGSCGSYNVVTENNSPSCGYSPPDPCAGCPGFGTMLANNPCSGCAGNGCCDSTATIADGCCGTIQDCCGMCNC